MGLIIKDKIQELLKGYPTVSDKYNVAGATLTGNTPVQFGELVKKSATKGYFESAAAGVADVYDLGGFVLATNVKLAQDWPGTVVQVNPGEAFNLFVSGFMAIELDSAATVSEITANAEACVILATGKVTTSDKFNEGTIEILPNVVFTGTYEIVGGKLLAEIYLK